MDTSTCPFCEIIAGRAPAEILNEWPDAIAIRPRGGGCTPGHILVIPRCCVPDIGADPMVSASTMFRAAQLAATLPAVNVITSRGADATQTVYHFHVHVVPRRPGDQLTLPWTPRTREVTA